MTDSTAKNSTRRHRAIPSLDGLRAVSIMLVIFGHAYHTVPSQSKMTGALFSVIGNAQTGVLIFFVISGYLITKLLRKEWDETRTIDLKKFYFRRTLRIFPAFYVYIATISSLAAFGILSIPKEYLITASFYVWNYGGLWLRPNAHGVWFLGHFWSLALEEQFYLLWPLTILVAGKRRAGLIAVTIILLMPPVRLISYALWPSVRGMLTMMFHTSIDPLMVGCVLGLFEGEPRFESILAKLFRWRVPSIAAAFCIFISPVLTSIFRGSYYITVGMTLDALSAGVVMLWLIRHADSKAGLVFNQPAISYVGVLSYSLYLWQQLFLTPFNSTFLGLFPLNIFASLFAAVISYYIVESPSLRLRQRWENKFWPRHATTPAQADTLPETGEYSF